MVATVYRYLQIDCESVVSDFGGSNPPSPTNRKKTLQSKGLQCFLFWGGRPYSAVALLCISIFLFLKYNSRSVNTIMKFRI